MQNSNKKFKNILGIDFGLKNIGLAISQGFLAEPLKTLKVKDEIEAIKKIKKIIKEEKIAKMVIGLSENLMAKHTKTFAEKLRKIVRIPVVFFDETLTSKEASRKMSQAGKPKRKRKTEKHQVAACLILQEYLDSINLYV